MNAIISYLSGFDSTILYAIQSIGPTWHGAAWFLSYGLGYKVMIPVFVLALFLIRRHRIAFELIVIAVASLAGILVLKYLFHAPRPYLVDPLVIKYDPDSGFGLPSAHAVMSVVTLGWVSIRHPKSHVLLWGTIILVLLIGASRVYLGVHYPTQVVAGWLFGILFLYIFRIIDKRLWSPFQKNLK